MSYTVHSTHNEDEFCGMLYRALTVSITPAFQAVSAPGVPGFGHVRNGLVSCTERRVDEWNCGILGTIGLLCHAGSGMLNLLLGCHSCVEESFVSL